MRPVHFDVPIRAHQQQAGALQIASQVQQEVKRAPVRPVQVLQDQQHRARLGKLSEHAEHRAEQLLLR